MACAVSSRAVRVSARKTLGSEEVRPNDGAWIVNLIVVLLMPVLYAMIARRVRDHLQVCVPPTSPSSR